MNQTDLLAQQVITLFQQHISLLGYTPLVHFELEGCCRLPNNQQLTAKHLQVINHQLSLLNIEGELVDEYWYNQWEYVSKFLGQTPLKEAQNLAAALLHIPRLFLQLGISEVLLKPVVWSGDFGQLARGSDQIFTGKSQRAVHIPNAIQLNVSALNCDGKNIITDNYFGEYLQQCFLKTSLECCLLYLPEEDAFERLLLKSKYGLAQELCSPVNISGGHQGSIALYKEHGKHNQPMGVETLVVDQYRQPLLSRQNWQKTARVEHRLGATSTYYNPFVNVAYALANIVDALDAYEQGECEIRLDRQWKDCALPQKLLGDDVGFDAVTLFKQSNWLAQRIDNSALFLTKNSQDKVNIHQAELIISTKLGSQLKRSILNRYQQNSDSFYVTESY